MTTYTIKQGAVNAKPRFKWAFPSLHFVIGIALAVPLNIAIGANWSAAIIAGSIVWIGGTLWLTYRHNNPTALRFVRSGAAWRVRFKLDRPPVGLYLSNDSIEYVGSTHIKLLGLYWSGWMVWQRMREAWRKAEDTQVWPVEDRAYWAELVCYWNCLKAALRQYLAWTHGNSARVIAAWREREDDGPSGEAIVTRGVSLSTYYYLQGRGAVTTGSPVAGREICWLPEDPDNPGWTVWGELKMEARETELQVRVKEDSPFGPRFAFKQAADFLSRRPWFFGLCKPHAANGPSSPHAPCDLTFEIERV